MSTTPAFIIPNPIAAMNQNRDLAIKIFEHLVSKGAELGDVSVTLIESVLNKELSSEIKTYEYGHEGGVVIVQARDLEQAQQLIAEKLEENDTEGLVPIDKIIDITKPGTGVIAYFDL